MEKICRLLLMAALLISCTPEPQPEPDNEFNQEVVDHDDIDYNWE